MTDDQAQLLDVIDLIHTTFILCEKAAHHAISTPLLKHVFALNRHLVLKGRSDLSFEVLVDLCVELGAFCLKKDVIIIDKDLQRLLKFTKRRWYTNYEEFVKIVFSHLQQLNKVNTDDL